MPIVPPAPVRFSITTCWPISRATRSPTTRATKSSPPPAASGTMNRTGRFGQLPSSARPCAPAARTAVPAIVASEPRRARATAMPVTPFRSLRRPTSAICRTRSTLFTRDINATKARKGHERMRVSPRERHAGFIQSGTQGLAEVRSAEGKVLEHQSAFMEALRGGRQMRKRIFDTLEQHHTHDFGNSRLGPRLYEDLLSAVRESGAAEAVKEFENRFLPLVNTDPARDNAHDDVSGELTKAVRAT